MGRPSDYNAEIAALICEQLAQGESLRKICAGDGMPATSTVCLWLSRHAEFSEQYAHAREAQADKLAEEILDIADDSSGDVLVGEDGSDRLNTEFVQRSKLRVDARKWLASKMAPKKYGDKITQEVTGKDGAPFQIVISSDDADL